MKSLSILVKKDIGTGEGTCDYCQENKQGFVGNNSIECTFWGIRYQDLKYEHLAILDVRKHYKPGFFSESKYILKESEEQFRHVAKNEALKHHVIKTNYSTLICADCVKEIYKSLK